MGSVLNTAVSVQNALANGHGRNGSGVIYTYALKCHGCLIDVKKFLLCVRKKLRWAHAGTTRTSGLHRSCGMRMLPRTRDAAADMNNGVFGPAL